MKVGAARETVAGISVSHPDRLIYPDLGLSKVQLARYYEEIGDWILPHIRGRPLTLVHCPAGVSGPCMFLRHAKAWGPSALRRVRIKEKTKVGEYLVADSISAVVALAQMGVVEIHTWNSTADDIERPNRLVWDLDPGPQIAWKQTVAAARALRELLKALGLVAWVKTTGGKGLHIVVPIKPSLWDASSSADGTRPTGNDADLQSHPAQGTRRSGSRARAAVSEFSTDGAVLTRSQGNRISRWRVQPVTRSNTRRVSACDLHRTFVTSPVFCTDALSTQHQSPRTQYKHEGLCARRVH